MCAPDELAAELNGSSVVDGDLLDAAANAIARLEHEDIGTTTGEIPRSRQTGETRSDDDDVDHPSGPLVVGEDAQRVGGEMRGDGSTDVVLLDVTRVRDERLDAVSAGKRDEHLRRRAQVDEALDGRRHAVLSLRRWRLDADALGPDREANDACMCAARLLRCSA